MGDQERQTTDAMLADDCNSLELGFIEEVDDELLLTSQFFPSKIGGKPAWLELQGIPSVADLSCKNCNNPMHFLAQLYCPIDGEAACFHRIIYIFCCKDEQCHRDSADNCFLVYRNQLPRNNKFYSNQPPDRQNPQDSYDHSLIGKWCTLCSLCGIPSEKHCSKCGAAYCCRQHQVFDWKNGHRENCSSGIETTTSITTLANRRYLFPQYEICIDDDSGDDQSDQPSNSPKSEDCHSYATSELANQITEADLKSLEDHNHDEIFLEFKEKIKQEPDQVLQS